MLIKYYYYYYVRLQVARAPYSFCHRGRQLALSGPHLFPIYTRTHIIFDYYYRCQIHI